MPVKIYVNNNTEKNKGMPWALDYYFRYPDHVIASGLSLRRDNVYGTCEDRTGTRPFHFLNLLRSIDATTSKHGDDIIIVCHGLPTELGIYQRPGTEIWINSHYLDGLINDFSGTMEQLAMGETDWDDMFKLLFRIRQKKLRHIAIQACRIGRSQRFLRQFATVLGARSVSAPTLRTVYGNCEVYLANDEQKKKFRVDYPSFFDVPVTGGGVVTMASKKEGGTILDVVMLTDSYATLLRFLNDNFPTMPNLGSMSKSALRNYGEMMLGIAKPPLLPYHGLVASKSPFKVYFPKDPRYTSHMTYLSVA